ncbi:MAG: glyoxalase [Actinobacteria bacterium 13_1_40CM_2_65_8]|nr:MAG: glyoxalase [Chloroflexi bacterium 13_1_40CM_4_65_13]OLD49851.1 MAG: glyoxalase [Actinobacteria bacterium 13_1_40CM_2_65_8]
MNVQISAVTIGVKDINRAKKFYSDGLGCAIDQDHPGFVSFKLGDGSTKLGLYAWDALAADAGVPADGSGFRGVTLNYIVESEARVAEVMALAEKAGATIVKPAQKAQWGGYFGHFSDPDGYLWKVSGY